MSAAQSKKESSEDIELTGDSKKHFDKFTKTVLKAKDAVTMLVRCHLLAEYYLDTIIATNIPRGDIIVDYRFQYSEKLIIVEALNVIPKEILDSLKKLNSVRNQCSHVLNYDISEDDIDKIGRPFGKRYAEHKAESGDNSRKLLECTLITLMASLSWQVQRQIDEKLGRTKEEKN